MSESTKKKIITVLFIIVGIIDILLLTGNNEETIPIGWAIFMELFVSIHMSAFVLYPLATIINDNPQNIKKTFLRMFIARGVFLIFCDIFLSTTVAILDFLSVFIGAFIVVPIFAVVSVKKNGIRTVTQQTTPQEEQKCPKCGNIIKPGEKYCASCGEKIATSQEETKTSSGTITQTYVRTTDFDQMFLQNDKELLETFIKKALKNAKMNQSTKMLPRELLKKKTIFCSILCVLLFAYVCMIFFHFPILTYIIGAIILLILVTQTKKYNIISYLKKEVKARPDEKISNIVMSAKESLVEDNKKKAIICGIVASIVLPLIIFRSPVILYEKMEKGFGVRFYAFGITNFKTAEIPATYKGQPVISLRGNTFSNMPLLQEVKLPETITEIRGQAFKNDIFLKKVNIPQKLEYLGGGAFYNCVSITSIILPDTLTTMGGEVFKNAHSLETIKLSENLTEIRGNSFEECASLKEITIPDKVTRIGGHAFYGNTSLSKVIFTEKSQLKEIGSSAFRKCDKLYSITIPKETYVNFRAFKESPTSINYFGYGEKTKFIYVTSEDPQSVIETKDYGTIYIKVNNVNYVSYDNWEVNVSITGGLNMNLTFTNQEREKLVVENYYLEITSCSAYGKVGINISYN